MLVDISTLPHTRKVCFENGFHFIFPPMCITTDIGILCPHRYRNIDTGNVIRKFDYEHVIHTSNVSKIAKCWSVHL